MDYRDLLKRYIDYVGACEGTTFISQMQPASGFGGFNQEEIDELKALDKEATEDYYKFHPDINPKKD